MTRGRKPGYKHSEETKAKMRESKLGVPKSAEHRKHNSECRKGAKIIVDENGNRHWFFPNKSC